MAPTGWTSPTPSTPPCMVPPPSSIHLPPLPCPPPLLPPLDPPTCTHQTTPCGDLPRNGMGCSPPPRLHTLVKPPHHGDPACAELGEGNMLHADSFQLGDSMSALEMMDPKMDAGLLNPGVIPAGLPRPYAECRVPSLRSAPLPCPAFNPGASYPR